MEQKITKISYANDVTLITLSALPSGKAVSQVLTAFAASGINVDMISQTAPQGGSMRLSFTVSDRDLSQVLTILGQISNGSKGLNPEILPGNCKIAFFDAERVLFIRQFDVDHFDFFRGRFAAGRHRDDHQNRKQQCGDFFQFHENPAPLKML